MALTYQPFAETPAVDKLAGELHEVVDRSVARAKDLDYTLSLFGGVALVLFAASRGGLFRLALLFLGGALVRKGLRHEGLR